ncbi:DUF1254 domain-containing protein [Brevibacillus ruminantium]|uniref:DUF1254 domain-containing protein n=1 Tax=Brevibacillus ruminantium TaxID=2950604 RepID=A0ABY4WLC6_9BACL|nr:DUF1254 domain-containing protein [Brevibacillus ruminantium]USG66655.1 DUF1254 domain-containing protein [Brevibacillus ruminantium]
MIRISRKNRVFAAVFTTILTVLSVLWSGSFTPVQQAAASPAAPKPEGSSRQPYKIGAIQAKEQLAYVLGVQAYLYGYPLVEMEKIKAESLQNLAPLNQFAYITRLATPADRVIVSPNADTLYLFAWLDLANGPVTLHVPEDPDGRYYTIEMLDAYTNVFQNVSSRSTKQKAGNYAIVGPSWKGKLPSRTKRIVAPTNMVWLIGRVEVKDQADLPKAVAFQKQFALSSPGNHENKAQPGPLTSAKSNKTQQVLDPLAFFAVMTDAIKRNPPPPCDEVLLDQFKLIGIDPSTGFQPQALDPPIIAGLTRAARDARSIIEHSDKLFTQSENGWTSTPLLGRYGDQFLLRAYVAYSGIGANVPSEEKYARTFVDSTGVPLNGKNKYVLHFAKDQIPDVSAFWSVTMYGPDFYLVPNSIQRYSIGSLTKGLVYNPDGSLDLYIQSTPPPKGESNWLPAPSGPFNLVLRMFEPRPKSLSEPYRIPPVRKLP